MRAIGLLFGVILSLTLSCDSDDNVLGIGSRIGINCGFQDTLPPEQITNLDEITVAAVTRSPEYTWSPALDFCGVSHYEWGIGTTPGGDDLVPFENIGLVTTFRDESLTLVSSSTYYTSIRPVDSSGNIGEPIISNGWRQLDPVRDLPNLILRLDATTLSSVRDASNQPASSGSFSGSVDRFLDTSTGGDAHHFFAKSAAYRPTFNPGLYLEFDGVSQALTVPDHVELNIGTVDQRNFSAVFETSSDITSTQVIYDEGGGVRGMNFYISSGRFYCGFYNVTEDGDGVQPFTSVSVPISANTKYVATWVFDYTNYTGPAGPNGSLNCYVNNVSIGTTSSTSKLYAHSGDIGLGGYINTTYYHTGVTGNGDGDYFNGKIYEFMIVNGVPTATDITNIWEYLSDKWSVP